VKDSISLEKLLPGESAAIARLIGAPDDVHRLREFGFHEGGTVEMFRPGDPCIVRIEGNMVCLRGGDRVRILLQPPNTPRA
jgi:Fe2+ transport system protein FeoA